MFAELCSIVTNSMGGERTRHSLKRRTLIPRRPFMNSANIQPSLDHLLANALAGGHELAEDHDCQSGADVHVHIVLRWSQ